MLAWPGEEPVTLQVLLSGLGWKEFQVKLKKESWFPRPINLQEGDDSIAPDICATWMVLLCFTECVLDILEHKIFIFLRFHGGCLQLVQILLATPHL